MQNVKMFDQPFMSSEKGSPPLTIRVVSTPQTMETTEGVMGSAHRSHTYVLFDVLPDELKKRVKLAIEALQTQL